MIFTIHAKLPNDDQQHRGVKKGHTYNWGTGRSISRGGMNITNDFLTHTSECRTFIDGPDISIAYGPQLGLVVFDSPQLQNLHAIGLVHTIRKEDCMEYKVRVDGESSTQTCTYKAGLELSRYRMNL